MIMSHQTEVVAAVAFVMTGVVCQKGVKPIGVIAAALAAIMSRMTDVGAASETDHVVIMVTCCPLLLVPRTELVHSLSYFMLPLCLYGCASDSIAQTVQAVLIL